MLAAKTPANQAVRYDSPRKRMRNDRDRHVCNRRPADASADAGGASSETTVKAGDSCVCPDGRTGTVHSYDEGLICIPNADQG